VVEHTAVYVVRVFDGGGGGGKREDKGERLPQTSSFLSLHTRIVASRPMHYERREVFIY
jgi:hypothetical protein